MADNRFIRKGNNIVDRADLITNVAKSINNDMGGAMVKFMDNAQPIKCTYYNINYDASVAGVGFNDTAGPYEGGIKYDIIHNYTMYGDMSERPVDLEIGEYFNTHWKLGEMTFLHAPGTIIPRLGDRISFAMDNHRYLFKVVNATPVNFNNKPFIRTVVNKCEVKNADYYEEDFIKDGLIVNIFEFQDNNVGTPYAPLLTQENLDNINSLEEIKKDILENFNEAFYDEFRNIYTSLAPCDIGSKAYTPLMVDLQMEFRPLWIYGINAILTHETIVNRRSKFNYKKNPVRRFLLKKKGAWDILKNEGMVFSPYQYIPDMKFSLYKIESYFNDGRKYRIFDYYHGEDVFYDEDGKAIAIMDNKQIIEIDEQFKDIFEKYYNDTLTVQDLSDFVEDYEYEEYNFSEMLHTMILMIIIDNMIMKSKPLNKFKGLMDKGR